MYCWALYDNHLRGNKFCRAAKGSVSLGVTSCLAPRVYILYICVCIECTKVNGE